MFIDKIKASIFVQSALNSEDTGIQGAVTTTIEQDLAYLGLDCSTRSALMGKTWPRR